MKRKLICLLLLLLTLTPAAQAASPAVRGANALYTLGLLDGVGQHSDGSPIYALDRSLTRQEAVVLLVRLLGQEQEALSAQYPNPFTDTAPWAAPYAALAAQKGYLQGIGGGLLGAQAPMTEQAWLTMLLRALGYSNASYDDPWTQAKAIGLAEAPAEGFTRAGAVTLSMTALGLPINGSSDTLLCRLVQADAVTEQEVRQAGMTDALSRRPLSAREISARCASAVVFLQMYANETDLETDSPCATASGFFIAADGVLLTNYHAVGQTMFAFATTIDGSRYQVRDVLFADQERDVAVLRLNPAELGTGEITASFPCLPMRSAQTVANGDIVYAIGSPLGLTNSISDGIVANRSRLAEQATGSPDPYIQVTAAISSGSSGGVLLNEFGEAIGITTATFAYGQNLNLAVPLDLAMSVDLSAAGTPYEEAFEAESSPYADIAMYEAYPDVPDFGALVGADLRSSAETEDGAVYLYDAAAASEDALAEYYQAMEAWGFTYHFNREQLQMVFVSQALGLSVLGQEVSIDLEGQQIQCYQIRILESIVDTTALRSDLFPWALP